MSWSDGATNPPANQPLPVPAPPVPPAPVSPAAPAWPAAPASADEEFLSTMAAEFDSVEAALVRLDDGTFDTCSVCGGRIGQDRLIADPLSTRCPAHS